MQGCVVTAIFKTWHFTLFSNHICLLWHRKKTLSTKAVCVFWNCQPLYLTRLLGLGCPGREARIFPPRDLKWSSSMILLCDLQHVTLETVLFLASSLVHSTSREDGKSPSRAWVCLGGQWRTGVAMWHLIPPHPDIFQNDGEMEVTPVHWVLNSLYSRKVQNEHINIALPPPQGLLSSTRNLEIAADHTANCLMTSQMHSF